jgi:hypothetical protein
MSKDSTKELVMKFDAATPMTFGDYEIDERMSPLDDSLNAPLDAAEELEWLMSLALDEALDERETARMELLLAQEPAHLERWVAWQAVDSALHQVPAVMPPIDFSAKFEQRLAISERRRRLRTGIIFGLAAVMLWGSALGGVVMLGVLLWANQSLWLGGLVHTIAYWWAAMGQFGQALVNSGEALWAAPQTRAVLVCYLVAAAGILVSWFVFLRRSLRVVPLIEA